MLQGATFAHVTASELTYKFCTCEQSVNTRVSEVYLLRVLLVQSSGAERARPAGPMALSETAVSCAKGDVLGIGMTLLKHSHAATVTRTELRWQHTRTSLPRPAGWCR